MSGEMRSNAWVELDEEVFRENVRSLRRVLSGRTELILVVKARAYGHGIARVARCAWECGVRWFVVAVLDEAIDLREVLPEASILLLGAAWPEDAPVLREKRIVPVIVSPEQGRALAAAARRDGVELACHVKVDTGMGRFGLAWEEAVPQIRTLAREGGLRLEGICTHFASAGQKNGPFAAVQAKRFDEVVDGCAKGGIRIPFRHIANSAAFTHRPDWDLEGVRCGILAYGYGGGRPGSRVPTRPCLQWKTRVVQVKTVPGGFPVGYLSTHVTAAPTVLATVNAGYADGYSRLLSNSGFALLGGRRVPVVGRVTMNFTTLDAGADAAVREGDEVVLLGRQGDGSIWADELARWCKTIPYEVLTSIRSPCRRA